MHCPLCNLVIESIRVNSLMVLEYRASCKSCGWEGIIRKIRCGGCHNLREFLWDGVQWKCTQCGHTRASSPPHIMNQTFTESNECA